MQTLSKRSFRVLREIARTLFDAGDGVREARLDWAISELRDVLGRVGSVTRFALRLSIAFLQLTPIFVLGRPARFTRLRPAERLLFLSRVEGSFFNILFVAVKLYLCMVYFEHPDAIRETGYDGDAVIGPRPAVEVAR